MDLGRSSRLLRILKKVSREDRNPEVFLTSVCGYVEEDDVYDVYKSQLIPRKNAGLSPNEQTVV